MLISQEVISSNFHPLASILAKLQQLSASLKKTQLDKVKQVLVLLFNYSRFSKGSIELYRAQSPPKISEDTTRLQSTKMFS